MPPLVSVRAVSQLAAAGNDEFPWDGIATALAVGLDSREILGMGVLACRRIEMRIGQGHRPTSKGGTACLLGRGVIQDGQQAFAHNVFRSQLSETSGP